MHLYHLDFRRKVLAAEIFLFHTFLKFELINIDNYLIFSSFVIAGGPEEIPDQVRDDVAQDDTKNPATSRH